MAGCSRHPDGREAETLNKWSREEAGTAGVQHQRQVTPAAGGRAFFPLTRGQVPARGVQGMEDELDVGGEALAGEEGSSSVLASGRGQGKRKMTPRGSCSP